MSPIAGNDWLWFADRGHLSFHPMGEVTYVFNHRSGETHVFNAVSIAMLEYFTHAPRKVSALVEDFPDLVGLSREDCPRGVVRRIFAELDDAGLVVPAGRAG
ncbi:HPr-rel-A system PqqD family peptide chaperone [Kordiimonas sp.]|uniref:HPr-rel-A system PqqD family peptide chaperone n=1 Tax=Kordiimonas sp. TaxID=1970157 RepID=UPI003A8ED52B